MATGGISFKAARVGDSCLHQGKVETGSGDTYTEDKKQARLGDMHSCKVHPPPPVPPGPGMGRIVTASTSVFVNNMGAARVTDLCLCMLQTPIPPDAANPRTSEYKVRKEDNYQELMLIEHEIAERDKVKDVKEPDKGAAGEVDDPTGVAEAKAPPRPPEPPPSPNSVTVKGKLDDQKPYPKEPPVAAGKSKKIESKDEDPKLAGGKSMTPPAKKKEAPGAPAAGKDGAAAKEKEKPREKPKVSIDLAFSMNLSIGMRLGLTLMGIGLDVITGGASKVYIGGMKPPSVEQAMAQMEEEKKKKEAAK
jgi:uncharacterized Zn-binding protein involved in type VI secretion